MELDLQRRQAIIDMMAIPDPFDGLRTHRRTHAGKPDRYAQVPMLTATFVQAKLMNFENHQENAA